jgi:hypothetical protein
MKIKKNKAYEIIKELSNCKNNVERKMKLVSILKKIEQDSDRILIHQKIPINKKFGDSNFILSSKYKTVLLITAHYDAYLLDKKTGKTVPGANDNASGVGILIDSIRYLKKLPIDFVFFGAEEIGCSGSSEFLKRNKKDILGMVNLDCCGNGGEKGILIPKKIKIKDNFLKTEKKLNLLFIKQIKKKGYKYCREDIFATGDHEEFLKWKLPATTLQGEDLKFFGLENGKYNFNLRIMHTKEDKIGLISKKFLIEIKNVLIEGVKSFFRRKSV